MSQVESPESSLGHLCFPLWTPWLWRIRRQATSTEPSLHWSEQFGLKLLHLLSSLHWVLCQLQSQDCQIVSQTTQRLSRSASSSWHSFWNHLEWAW
jgi:hypothetical protein